MKIACLSFSLLFLAACASMTGPSAVATLAPSTGSNASGTVHEYLFDFAVREGTMRVAPVEPASAIKIVRKREEVEGCELLGEIAAHPPYIWPGDDFRQLRGKASALGADTVLVPGRRIGSVEGFAYRCKAR